MSTLLKKYQKAPTLKNAEAVAAYHRRHPFASIMLDSEDATWLELALEQAGEG